MNLHSYPSPPVGGSASGRFIGPVQQGLALAALGRPSAGRPAIGMDEVGRGAMAGPLVAAAVALPPTLPGPAERTITDSKVLASEERVLLDQWIRAHAELIVIECIGVPAINRLGIGWANRAIYGRLMARVGAGRFLVDGNLRLHGLAPTGSTIVCRCGGDRRDRSIAAASIVAKVYRDRLMGKLHEAYPWYGWAHNAGYATTAHRHAILTNGPCVHHRMLYLRRLLAGKDD